MYNRVNYAISLSGDPVVYSGNKIDSYLELLGNALSKYHMGWDTETKMSIYEKETEVMKNSAALFHRYPARFIVTEPLIKAMREVADFLINKGVDGLFYLGTVVNLAK